MKKIICLLICVILITGCSKNKEYHGYWCTYNESNTIIILLDKNISNKIKNNVEDTINTFEDLTSYDYIKNDEIAIENNNPNDIYDMYFIYLNSSKNIDDYIDTLNSTKGVHSATKNVTKNNMKFYNLKEKNKFTYQTNISDSSTIIEGTYKIKDNEIIFKSDKEVPSLFIKNEFICTDKECNTILFKTDNLCQTN